MRGIRSWTLGVALLVVAAVPAFAQDAQPGPQPFPGQSTGIFDAVKQTLGKHLALGMLGSYDWVAGDWDRPYAVGPVVNWVVNDQFIISGGGKYILNSHQADRWRSELQVLVPLYGGERMR